MSSMSNANLFLVKKQNELINYSFEVLFPYHLGGLKKTTKPSQESLPFDLELN